MKRVCKSYSIADPPLDTIITPGKISGKISGSKFIVQLYCLLRVSDRGHGIGGVIEWNSKGDAFSVMLEAQFSKLLPEYFKATSFSSFVRQLNMYSFYKVKGPNRVHTFKHPFFMRDFPQGLSQIKRKIVKASRLKKLAKQAELKTLKVKEIIINISQNQNMIEEILTQNDKEAEINGLLIEKRLISQSNFKEMIHQILSIMILVIIYPDASFSRELSCLYDQGEVISLIKRALSFNFATFNKIPEINENIDGIIDILTSIAEIYNKHTFGTATNLQETSQSISPTQITPDCGYAFEDQHHHLFDVNGIDETYPGPKKHGSDVFISEKAIPLPVLGDSDPRFLKFPTPDSSDFIFDLQFEEHIEDMADLWRCNDK